MPETLTACPICESQDIRKKLDGAIFISICRECDQHFVNPRMTDDEVTAYYQGPYWTEMSGGMASGLAPMNLIRHQQRARLQAISLQEWLIGMQTCLEIGCSAGYLLDDLHTFFQIEGFGVEPDLRHHAVEPAKKYELYRDLAEVPERTFDLLALSHSLEHLNHPLEFMGSLIARHAHGGTRIMIEVPNLDQYPDTLSPRHPFAYNERTLNQLMERLGCAALKIIKHGLGGSRMRYLLGMYGLKEDGTERKGKINGNH